MLFLSKNITELETWNIRSTLTGAMTVNIIEGKNYEDQRTYPNDAHRSAVGDIVGTYAGSGRIPSNIYTVFPESFVCLSFWGSSMYIPCSR